MLHEGEQGAHPLLLDVVVIAGESPGALVLAALGLETVRLGSEGLADVLAVHEVAIVEEDLEGGGVFTGSYYLLDLDYLEGALGQLVEVVEHPGVA